MHYIETFPRDFVDLDVNFELKQNSREIPAGNFSGISQI
jgi:hypothetical protein